MTARSDRVVLFVAVFLLVTTGIVAGNMVLDPDQDPVASFPGNIDLQGNSILDCDTINGVDCDSLGSGGGGSGDADYSEVVNRSGDNMTGDLLMNGNDINSVDDLRVGAGSTSSSKLYLNGNHIVDVDDLNFNGGANDFSAIAVPQTGGTSGELAVAAGLWGSDKIMQWNEDRTTDVFGDIDMQGNNLMGINALHGRAFDHGSEQFRMEMGRVYHPGSGEHRTVTFDECFSEDPYVFVEASTWEGGQRPLVVGIGDNGNNGVSQCQFDYTFCEHDSGDSCDSHSDNWISWMAIGPGSCDNRDTC